MTNEQIELIAKQTDFSVYQIQTYLNRIASLSVDDATAESNIREAALFDIDIDLLGR